MIPATKGRIGLRQDGNACVANDSDKNTKGRKKQPMEGEKIFANYASNYGLVSRTYEKPLQFNHKKINNPT